MFKYLVHPLAIPSGWNNPSRSRLTNFRSAHTQMSMRIRVFTFPPLPITKVWSSLGNLPSSATVGDLKRSLCKQVPALKGLKSDEIRLFVDDFELLEVLSIDIVRENDTVE